MGTLSNPQESSSPIAVTAPRRDGGPSRGPSHVPNHRYVLMTAAYNEEAFIERTIDSVLAQSLPPERWVIVSDGSTDATDEIVQRHAERHNFISYLRMTRPPGRSFRSKVVALHAASKLLRDVPADFIGNLDADVSVEPSYYQDLISRFNGQPPLGLAGGFVLEDTGKGFRNRQSNRDYSVAHAAQLVRRECYEEIGGYAVLEYGGEDWHAQTSARMKGWQVQAFPELRIFHHRHTGEADNLLRHKFRQGRMDYSFGSHPLFEVFKCLQRLLEKPLLVGGLVRLSGFTWSWVRGDKRPVSKDFVTFLRGEQKQKLRSPLRHVWRHDTSRLSNDVLDNGSDRTETSDLSVNGEESETSNRVNKSFFENRTSIADESQRASNGFVPTNGFQVEVDKVTELEWSLLISRFADANIYQTWAYASIRWGDNNLSHLVLKRDGEVVGIAQLRIIRPAPLRFGIAYLRWGPLCHVRERGLSPDVVRAMMSALREEYSQKRGLYLEIMPNAFVGSARADVFQSATGQFVSRPTLSQEKYRTLLLELTLPLEQLRKNLDRKWRNHLNASERNGLQIIQGTTLADYSAFTELYARMWGRKKFKTSVSVEEFGRIQDRLPQEQRMMVFQCLHQGRPIAAVVCPAIGESAIYLLGASVEEGMKLGASYLLQWTAIRWSKDKGSRYYDLGGIDPLENPGVYNFKKGLSGADVSHMESVVSCDNGMSLGLAKASQVFIRQFRRFQLGSAKN
jgi:lipid II:glycine glycyltransferase (peptidoglycan interpeptide bridge formation enzyme)/glycosyltransferase involved in cell wall biosynthesis